MAARKIETYEQACGLIGFPYNEMAKELFAYLEKEGHTEKSICYAMFRRQIALRNLVEKYNKYKDNDHNAKVNFLCAWQDKIEEFSWKQDDLRWKEYNKRLSVLSVVERVTKDKESKQKYIYFIQGECGGAIKIGLSDDPLKRIKQLQTGYPDLLKVLALVPGDESIERSFHDEFSSFRLKGEWFKPDSTLIERIAGLGEG